MELVASGEVDICFCKTLMRRFGENRSTLKVQPPRRILRYQCFLAVMLAGLLLASWSAKTAAQAAPVPYKHAYYLFLEGGGSGCEECYVPLLITRNSLD